VSVTSAVLPTRTRARRFAVAAVYGSGGLGLVGALAAGVLVGQARLARRIIPRAESPAPRCDGYYGTEYPGEPLKLVILGDSTAAGYGAERARDTPGALLAAGLVERLHRPVALRCFAVVGAVSPGLVRQVERAIEEAPDIAVIFVGANDVTHRIRTQVSVRYLADAVRALRAIGTEVVVGTCPDLGVIRPIQPPLRWVARRWSRDLAAAQTVGVVEAGGATVSLGDLIGPAFHADPVHMFAPDRFHPSGDGYAAAAAAVLPTLVKAAERATLGAGVQPVPADRPSLARGEGVRSLAQAAAEAADRAGTEVSAARVAGRSHGPAGRWAQLRYRVRQLTERRADPRPAAEAELGDQPGGDRA
jgi:lysophospholipase L1-like esterase